MGSDPGFLSALPPDAAVCVGLSGGLDSVVLLDLMHREARAASRSLTALHVHHGLSPNADDWARFCTRLCADLDVPLAVERVKVDRESPAGLEGAARAARYAAFARRPEPFVALAHHLDDQAETVLIQLLRGTGLKGVAAMPVLRALPGSRVQLFRPLLGVPRSQLAQYAKERKLAWIEDESNASTAHDRNFLRHELAPMLDARFPGWREAATRFSRHAGAANALLEELARRDGVPPEPGAGLPIVASLSSDRRANAVRAFLAVNALPMPSEARLAEMAKQLYEARGDARVRLAHAGVSLVRHRDVVQIDASGEAAGDWRVPWHGENDVDLGPGRGRVHFAKVKGEGLARALAAEPDWYFAPRSGGEKIRLHARRPTRTLKNLLQEHAVPEWQREKLPLLFKGSALAWVPGIGIAADFACEAGAEGVLPTWRVAGKGSRMLE